MYIGDKYLWQPSGGGCSAPFLSFWGGYLLSTLHPTGKNKFDGPFLVGLLRCLWRWTFASLKRDEFNEFPASRKFPILANIFQLDLEKLIKIKIFIYSGRSYSIQLLYNTYIGPAGRLIYLDKCESIELSASLLPSFFFLHGDDDDAEKKGIEYRHKMNGLASPFYVWQEDDEGKKANSLLFVWNILKRGRREGFPSLPAQQQHSSRFWQRPSSKIYEHLSSSSHRVQEKRRGKKLGLRPV